MKSGRPEAGEFAEYATSDIDFVAGDDAVDALRAQSADVLAFHIAGHELHHLRTLRERYLA